MWRAPGLPAMMAVLLATGCAGDVDPPPAGELVRPGARPTTVRSGDLDGDDQDEVVVASVSEAEEGFGVPYLEVFDHRDGVWVRVFDGTGRAPPGPPGTPSEMLVAGDGFVVQSVHLLELVDFRADATPEVVVAIASAGATSGPLELWVVAMTDRGPRTEFFEGTQRGGEVAVQGERVSFRFPVYREEDPGCCPSAMERETIGLDAATGRIGVLERERVRT